jgi:hypothetical protein
MKKFNPAIQTKYFILIAGVAWSVVGILLCRLALLWLSTSDTFVATGLALSGIFLSLLIHHLGFLKIADRNIERIRSMKDRACIFGFQPWKSYIIIVIMIGMGITLRHSSLPRPYLSIIYMGFGGAMIMSSLKYYWAFFKNTTNP